MQKMQVFFFSFFFPDFFGLRFFVGPIRIFLLRVLSFLSLSSALVFRCCGLTSRVGFSPNKRGNPLWQYYRYSSQSHFVAGDFAQRTKICVPFSFGAHGTANGSLCCVERKTKSNALTSVGNNKPHS